MRRTNDIIGQILLFGLFFVAGATPLVILILSILNFVRNPPRRVAIVLKGLGALAIWGSLTLTLMLISFMIVMGPAGRGSTFSDLQLNLIFALQGLIYVLIGAVLIYWMKRQARSLPGA